LGQIKVIVEKHADGYVAYPVGPKRGVAQGDSCKEALAEVKSAVQFHVETLERQVLEMDGLAQETFVAETGGATGWGSLRSTLSRNASEGIAGPWIYPTPPGGPRLPLDRFSRGRRLGMIIVSCVATPLLLGI
jgi:predicted RNase H-like HicB family nuclease